MKSIKIRLWKVVALVPVVIAGIVVEYFPPALIDMFAYGGFDVFLYNLCILILTPYIVIFLLALGDLYLSRLPKGGLYLLHYIDLRLFAFFAGCGVLTIFGFILGLANLLYFWVCFPIFIVILYIYLIESKARKVAIDLWDWVLAKNIVGNVRFLLIVQRLVLIAVIIAILLSKGILLEMFKDGGLHQYFSYFADTRLYHSTWMNSSHPILFDYLSGRGQGVLLFFTSFTNQFIIQIVGTIYLVTIATIVRQVIILIFSIFNEKNENTSFCLCLPDIGMLLALTSLMLDMETARFHIQTGAFFMFLAWAGCMFHIVDVKNSKWLFLSLIPIVIAYPITGGIYYAFVLWILGIIFLSLLLTRKTALLKYVMLLLVYGASSTIFSFGLNWLYVGIPEIQPAQVFIPLIWMEHFQHWSSQALVLYLDSSMTNSVSASNITFQKIGLGALALFSFPLNIFSKWFDFSQFIFLLYPILMVSSLLWFIIGYVQNRSYWEGRAYSVGNIFIYWLTFISLYVLRFLLTSVIQQSSLKRMLLFMEVFPIIVFFSLIIFWIHRVICGFQNKGLGNSKQFREKIIGMISTNRFLIYVVPSLIWSTSLTFVLINLWSYFWRISLPFKLILLGMLIAISTSIFNFFLKRIVPYFSNLRKNYRITLIASIFLFSLVLVGNFFPFTPLSLYFPVQHNLKITALDDKNLNSQSNNVRLIEIKVNDKDIRFNSLLQKGEWVRENRTLKSDGKAELTYTFTSGWASTVEILFESSQSAGMVQIEYDTREIVIKDLYSDETSETSFFIISSVYNHSTSLLLVVLLFVAEYFVVFGLASFVFTFFTFQATYTSTFVLFGMTLAYFQFQANFGFGKASGAWLYFTGSQGAIKSYGDVITYGINTGDRSDIFHCLEILEVVPGPAQILNLNGFGAIEPCLFSPLLPRDKIVHHYESVPITEPYYENLMFGEPEVAYAIYRDLGIDYFYLRKEDTLFVNLGYSEALKPENLEKYFDIYVETDDFYILTWRGQGMYPIPQQLAQDISLWYQRSNEKKYNLLNFWWFGRESLKEWLQSQE